MTKQGTTTATPRLRFPEFRNQPWDSRPLKEIAPLQRGFDLTSSDVQPGNIPVVYSNGVQRFHSAAMASAPGLMTGRSGTIGKLHFIESGDYWPHNTSLWVTSFMGNVPKFVYFLFDSIGMGRFASGSGVPTLNRNDVHAFASAVPPSLAEQKKIADCLTSLDEVIAAQGRKVEALKAHKRGLMQQLFPREGETRPRLRFPEFRNAAEWALKRLDEVSPSIFDGTHQTPTYTVPGIPFYSVENLISGSANKYISREDYLLATKKNKPEKGDVLLTRIGKIGHSQVVTWDHDFSVYVTLAVIKMCPDVDSHFLHYAIQSDLFQAEIRSKSLHNAVPPKINMDSLRSTQLLIADPAEQQRIADCLSSLDTQIAAESNQLAALKTHKQGLMQQLFPAPEGVAA